MYLNQLALKHNYISPPKERQERIKNENVSFSIRLLNLNLGVKLINDTDEKIYIKASFFDLNYKLFFGKQWESSYLETNIQKSDVFSFECNQAMYFHTSFVNDLALVFEIIKYKSDGKQCSLGWSVFNLLKCTTSITDLKTNIKSEPIAIEVYKGTPRALLQLTESPEANPKVKIHENSILYLNINLHKAFDICYSLIPEFFLVHEDDNVPGLERDSDGFTDFEHPKLTKFHTYGIEKVKVIIEPSLEIFENDLIQDINNDRLKRDVTVVNKDASSLKIIERRLRVGVHNGLMFVEDNDTIYLNVQDPQVRKKSSSIRPPSVKKIDELNCLTANNSVEVSMPMDKEFTLVFILEYTIEEKISQNGIKNSKVISPTPQHTYQIRYISYEPFSQQVPLDSLKSGIRLDLNFSGGSINAPENVLVYRSDFQLNSNPTLADGDKINASKTTTRLLAIMSEKDIDHKEPVTAITNVQSLKNDLIIEKKDLTKTFKEPPPKPAIREKLLRSSVVETVHKSSIRTNESDIQEAQMRAFQEFLLLQQQQKSNFLSQSQSIPPATIVALPNDLINMWKTQQLGDDKIVNYDSIDSYVVNEKFSSTAGGRSAGLFPLQIRTNSGLGLSRAMYSKMHDAGFPELIDCNGNQPFVIDPSTDDSGIINFNIEEKDPKECNQIIFQFMALSSLDNNENSMSTKSVFFTFQFYRFPVMSTERLVLDKIIEKISNYEKSTPMILRKTDESGVVATGPPGTMIKYMLDSTFMKPGEMFSFLNYLEQQVLHIDVWNGDSLLLIGSCAVNLKNLLRQGKSSVQISYELDILSSFEEDSVPQINGRLHLKIANLGSVPSTKVNKLTLKPHQRKGVIIDATEIEGYSMKSLSAFKLGGSLRDIYKSDDIYNYQLDRTNIVVRPQPAVSKNRELYEMLEKSSFVKGNSSMSPVKSPLMNEDIIRGTNHDRSKKLERLKTVLKKLENEQFNVNDNKLILEAKRSEKADKLRILQTIQCYREQQKGETIRKFLNGVIENEITLYPKFGCTELFEIKIKNHFNIDTNVNIEISDTRNYLAPVINPFELKALKALHSVTTSSENDLITFNKEKGVHQIFMKAKETVLVPFKYTNMTIQINQVPISPSSPAHHQAKSKLIPTEIENQIVFRTSENKLLCILKILIVPQPPVIDQTFRFFNPEQSFLKKLIRMPPLYVIAGPNDAIQTLSRCSDPEVLVDCQPVPVGTPHDVHLKVPCGQAPQIREFLVALYVDKFLLKPIQIWHFNVHSKSRIDVITHQGKPTNIILLLKGTSTTHHVQVYTSHPEEISIGSVESNSFTLAAHATYELSLCLTTTKIGNRRFQVNVVDVNSRILIRSWIICAICKEPEISKMFEIQLPTGGGDVCKKRIGFQNPYPHRKKFYISTDRPDLILLKDSILTVNANEVENIGMVFVPVLQRGKQKIYVFINDEDGMNEETFALVLNYQ